MVELNLKEIKDFFKDLIIIVLVVFIVRWIFILPFQINGQSMYPSYYDKEFIIVDRFTYRFKNPDRGDVVVFKPYISKDKEFFLKRIVAIPGDALKIENGEVFIKTSGSKSFVKLDENYLNKENKSFTFVGSSRGKKIYILRQDEYFVMGDNRNHSTDSRECFSNCIIRDEFISKSDIIGKVWIDFGFYDWISYDNKEKKIKIGTFKFLHPILGIDTFPRLFSSPSTYDYNLE